MDRPDALIRVGQVVTVELGDECLSDVTVVSLPCRETGDCWAFFYPPENKLFYIFVNQHAMIWRAPPKPQLVKK